MFPPVVGVGPFVGVVGVSVLWSFLKRSSRLFLRVWNSDLRSVSFLTRLRALVTRFLTLRPTCPMRDAMRVAICSATMGQARPTVAMSSAA